MLIVVAEPRAPYRPSTTVRTWAQLWSATSDSDLTEDTEAKFRENHELAIQHDTTTGEIAWSSFASMYHL